MDLKDLNLLRDCCYLNGQWVGSDDRFPVINPASGAELARVPRLGGAATRQVIHDAEKTWPAWRALTVRERSAVLRRWYDLILANTEDLARLMSWNSLFGNAINYAQNGFAVSTSLARWEAINVDPSDNEFRDLQRFDGFRQTYLKPDGSAYKTGEVLKLPELAATLKTVAKGGANAFYRGPIAKKIVAEIEANGGVLTLDDFAKHQANWVKPLSVNYRGYTAWNLPPNTQGMSSLGILNVLNNFDLKSMGEGSADYYHTVVEATKQVFADRDKWLTDPDFVKIPVDELLSVEHGKAQAARIQMDKAQTNVKPLDPKGDTVWIGVVDKDGNAVSLIQSIYFDFGSAIVPKGTGVLMQNRGSFFSLDKNHVNHLEPHKRTFHTLNAALLTKDGKAFMARDWDSSSR